MGGVWKLEYVTPVLRYASGVILGVLAPPFILASLALTWIVAMTLTHPAYDPAKPLRVAISGEAVSKSSGAVVVVDSGRAITRQHCRGTCDDLRIEDARDTLDVLRVLDATGRCVACLDPPDSGGEGDGTWSVAGVQKLVIAKERLRD